MKYYGKYRGKVLSTADPTVSGRLLCSVAVLPGMELNWATPCVPYASIGQGFFALPIEGADVWIEFEGGEPDKPIWSGSYWEMGEEPAMPELDPLAPELINVLRSKFCTVLLNDTPGEGGLMLNAEGAVAEVPVTVTLNEEGFAVVVGELSLTMNPEVGITLTAGETVMTLTEELVSIETPTVTVTAEDEINVTSPETSVEGDVNITGAVEIEGDVDIAGAVEIEGDVDIVGAVEVQGDVNVTGAVEIEGEANVLGALTIEGETNILGALTIEGDENVAGAQQIEGNLAVAGVIEGIVVPPLL